MYLYSHTHTHTQTQTHTHTYTQTHIHTYTHSSEHTSFYVTHSLFSPPTYTLACSPGDAILDDERWPACRPRCRSAPVPEGWLHVHRARWPCAPARSVFYSMYNVHCTLDTFLGLPPKDISILQQNSCVCIHIYSKTSNRPPPQIHHSPISIALFWYQIIAHSDILTP